MFATELCAEREVCCKVLSKSSVCCRFGNSVVKETIIALGYFSFTVVISS